jgi:hypothetical protein
MNGPRRFEAVVSFVVVALLIALALAGMLFGCGLR